MAIFGDLSDLPFPEVLTMLGRRTGRLEIVLPERSEKIEVHLEQGVLRGVKSHGKWLDDTLQVRDRLTSLMEAPSGCFDFHRAEAGTLHRSLELSSTQLLLSIAAAADEISHFRDRFAHPETRFVVHGGEEVWLDQELYEFLERSRPHLLSGANAAELARKLGLSVEQVQLNLYKLRSVGRVAPVRRFVAEQRPPAPPRAATPKPVEPSGRVVPFEAVARATPPRPNAAAAKSTRSQLRSRISGLLRSLKSRMAS